MRQTEYRLYYKILNPFYSCVTLYLNKSKSLETVEKEEEKKSEQNPGEMGV
jgi:hypothetical protein